MTTPTPDEICERLDYIAAILEANAHKFTVPDHIPAKVKTLRFAKATIERLNAALRHSETLILPMENCALRNEALDTIRAALGKDAK